MGDSQAQDEPQEKKSKKESFSFNGLQEILEISENISCNIGQDKPILVHRKRKRYRPKKPQGFNIALGR